MGWCIIVKLQIGILNQKHQTFIVLPYEGTVNTFSVFKEVTNVLFTVHSFVVRVSQLCLLECEKNIKSFFI